MQSRVLGALPAEVTHFLERTVPERAGGFAGAITTNPEESVSKRLTATGPTVSSKSQPAAAVSDDIRLASAVLRKDRKATAEFIDRYADPLYGYLSRRLIPRTDLVDDLVQEVFLAAWESLGAFQGQASLKAWLLGIARHKVEDHYRARLRDPEPLADQETELNPALAVEPLIDKLLDRDRLERKTKRLLEELPEAYSAILLWRYWEHRSAQEMAERTGKSVKAIERMLARAREQFKRRWQDE